MELLNSIEECLQWRRGQEGSVGFIPTMGALHGGHLSLVRLSKQRCKNTIVSIFINPTQFADNEDLGSYPQALRQDLKYLEIEAVDAVFLPGVDQMYQNNKEDYYFDTPLAFKLEGKSRPRFFKGVTTVVHKLFLIVKPTHAVFGQKDAQQLLIIKKMISKNQYGITLIEGPSIRNEDGLALSSRNNYLNQDEQNMASNVYAGLLKMKAALNKGEKKPETLKLLFKNHLDLFPQLKIDYISIACKNTLEEVETIVNQPLLVSAAVYINSVRLIDNFSYFSST